MNVFISSVIVGMEADRDAVRKAAAVLRHGVSGAEDFGARADTPQRTCLAGVRAADATVLLLGDRYGAIQESGLSATHEEYREARESSEVLAFVRLGTSPETRQQEFLDEVQGWAGGQFTATYTTPDELLTAVTRALHELELTRQRGPVDEEDLKRQAEALLPRGTLSLTGVLHIAIAGAPRRLIVRPAQLGDVALIRDISREATYGEHPIFHFNEGVQPPTVEGDVLLVRQSRAAVAIDEYGGIRITQPARAPAQPGYSNFPLIVEEELRDHLHNALRYAGWLLDRVDSTRRLTHVAVALRLDGGGLLGWRTREEDRASPNSATLDRASDQPVSTEPYLYPRPALLLRAGPIADDLTVLLRRRFRESRQW